MMLQATHVGKKSPQEYGAMQPDNPLPQQECLKLSLFLNLKSIAFEASY